MPANPATHPSAELLQSFNLGKLDKASADKVVRHLEACPSCRQQLAGLSGDSFLGRLREAHANSGTMLPAGTPPRAASHAGRPANSLPPGVSNLVPELADNLQYHVVRELGRGGMGVVYLAKNVLMDRLEVLKVVNKSLFNTPGATDRFLREIRSAAQLSHHNVVKAHSALILGDLLVFAMEYVEGQDLAKVVRQHGPLPVTRASSFLHQAALGLQHAHEHGMVHRDIKPHNLILSREGNKEIVKILDFGLAKATCEGKTETGLTGAGVVLGTPDYIAPEQALDAATADIRADIYSLGCTLYALLSGAPPFSGKSVMEVLQAHVQKEARPLNQLRNDVPAELAAVVAKMMAKEPAKRYPKPIEVAQALAPFCKTGPVLPNPPPTSQVSSAPKGGKSSGDASGVKAVQGIMKAPAKAVAAESVFAGLDGPAPPAQTAVLRSNGSGGRRHGRWLTLLAVAEGTALVLLGIIVIILLTRRDDTRTVVRTDFLQNIAGQQKDHLRNEVLPKEVPPKRSLDAFQTGTVWKGGVYGKWTNNPMPVVFDGILTVRSREGNSFKARVEYDGGKLDRELYGVVEKDVIKWSGKAEKVNRGDAFPGFTYVGRIVDNGIFIRYQGYDVSGKYHSKGFIVLELQKE